MHTEGAEAAFWLPASSTGWARGVEPRCAVCGAGESADVSQTFLTHGVTVLLCYAHRAETYQEEDGGQTFVDALVAAWTSAGCMTRARIAALRAHIRRIARAGQDRDKPGSYSWPRLRAEAEARFAAGEPPRRVIHELRSRHRSDDATAPSARTMRRWFAEARWLTPTTPLTASGHRRERPLSERHGILDIYDWWLGVCGVPIHMGFSWLPDVRPP